MYSRTSIFKSKTQITIKREGEAIRFCKQNNNRSKKQGIGLTHLVKNAEFLKKKWRELK